MSTTSLSQWMSRQEGLRGEVVEHKPNVEEARRRYLQYLERRKAARSNRQAAELLPDEDRLKETVRHRFRLVHPLASEEEFQAYWQTVLDDMSRLRAQQMLERIKEGLNGDC
ncbi:MAG TPA: hypothetical protein VNO70_09185 [Blastocatellia bacterium]|nr:hypothetical protein [Blastocatellia bacterium]